MPREQELVAIAIEIKKKFRNNPNIPEEYYALMADYVDSLDEVKDSMHIDIVKLVNSLPLLVSSIREEDLGGLKGRTDGHSIIMNKNLSKEEKKLYFFHELTHAIQTSKYNNREICSFYNGNNGMFLTEGATQYTAEILYHVSNGTNINYREQVGAVRAQGEHTIYSPLSEYQLNGNMLQLMSISLDLPIPDILSMGYRVDGREMLKQWYETYENNDVKFDDMMEDMEKIYDIDKLVIAGYSNQLSGDPVTLRRTNGDEYKGNLQMENDLIVKTERDFMNIFLKNHDKEYIYRRYEEFSNSLTTPSLKKELLNAIKEMRLYENQSEVTMGYGSYGFVNIIILSGIALLVGLIIFFIAVSKVK